MLDEQEFDLNRRRLLKSAFFSCALPFASLPARSQERQLPLVGVLGGSTEAAMTSAVQAFEAGLHAQRLVPGADIKLEYRWANGDHGLLPRIAADLIRNDAAVLVAFSGVPAIRAAMQATSSIPIVFVTGADPVRLGIVQSLSQPGGNVTGVTDFSVSLNPKRLQFLREVAPGVTTIGVFLNRNNPAHVPTRDSNIQAAKAMGLVVVPLYVASDEELNSVAGQIRRYKIDALSVAGDPFHVSRRTKITRIASGLRIPAIYSSRAYVNAGGLMSYGPKLGMAYRRAAGHVARILHGVNPGLLPVLQPDQFEMVINLRAAKEIGLAIPSGSLTLANEIME